MTYNVFSGTLNPTQSIVVYLQMVTHPSTNRAQRGVTLLV